jgi:uncharacterized membrane protein YfhO
LGDADALHALTESNFDGSKVVFLPPEAKSLVTVTNQTEAHVLGSKIGTRSVEADVEAAAPALVVVSQSFYHDWRASVDGRQTPLLRANYAFQAIAIPQGKHNVRLIYRDRAFEIGATISIITGLVCLFCYLNLKMRAGR